MLGLSQENTSPKSDTICLILTLGLSRFAAERFYVGKIGGAFIQILTSNIDIILFFVSRSVSIPPTTYLILTIIGYAALFLWKGLDIIMIVNNSFTDGKGRVVCSRAVREENGIIEDRSSFKLNMFMCIMYCVLYLVARFLLREVVKLL
jgi:hypothetical protein